MKNILIVVSWCTSILFMVTFASDIVLTNVFKSKKMKTLKKIVMAAAISLFAASVSDAQVYVSGSLSLSHSAGETEYKVGSKTETYDSNPVNSFTISPEIGFYVADGMSIGAEISYQFTKKKNASDKDYWTSDNMFYFNPFFRWDFIDNSTVAFGAKAVGILGFGSNKNQDEKNYKKSDLGFEIRPVLDYKFSEHWAATVSFGSLYFKHYVEKAEKDHTIYDTETKDIDNGIGVNLSLTSLRFGVVYTF